MYNYTAVILKLYFKLFNWKHLCVLKEYFFEIKHTKKFNLFL